MPDVTAIHLDPVGGIAGDMFVAALLDAFPDLTRRVMDDGTAVLADTGFTPHLTEGTSGGLRVQRFGLAGDGVTANTETTYPALLARINHAPLNDGTARHAAAILTVLAQAEASVHGCAIDDVHFHEIADWDSLLDVVAAGSIAAALDRVRWTVSPLPLGAGLVDTRHGALPVPAPATAVILDGFAWRNDGVGGERVTPTGAAILKSIGAHSTTVGAQVSGRLTATGMGAGTRDLPAMANILRAMAFTGVDTGARDTVTVISFEVDDMTGEEIGTAAERLRLVSGVLDLSIAGRAGKKNRPMHGFQVLCAPTDADTVIERCFLETTTIGLRVRDERRVLLDRAAASGDGLALKKVRRPDGRTTVKAENDAIDGTTLADRRTRRAAAEDAEP